MVSHVDQVLENFSVKDPVVNIKGFAGQLGILCYIGTYTAILNVTIEKYKIHF